jgi:hypothetical protein
MQRIAREQAKKYAYCLVSACPDFRVNVYQMVKMGKLNCVAGSEIPKRYIR